jgi:hypothetical protein
MSELEVEHFSFVNCYHHSGAWQRGLVDKEFLTELFYAPGNIDERRHVIALGGAVHDVLSHMRVDHFTLPHPSYRNRLLNDPDVERERINSCKRWLMD